MAGEPYRSSLIGWYVTRSRLSPKLPATSKIGGLQTSADALGKDSLAYRFRSLLDAMCMRVASKKRGAFRPVLGSLEAKFHADEAVAHRPPNSISTFGHASVTPAERYGTYSPNLPSQPINVIPRLNSATACVGSAPRLVSIIENHLLDVGFRDARLDFGKQILSNRTFLKRTNERNHIA